MVSKVWTALHISMLPRHSRKIFLLSHVARVVVLRPSDLSTLQIFLSFFKTLVGKEIAVELKNDVVLTGTLHSVDQYLNVKLMNVKIINPEKYPQLTALHNCFVRGSVVRSPLNMSILSCCKMQHEKKMLPHLQQSNEKEGN
jgi:U6 snRNA-associated Sm-like protein LSm2